MKRSFAMAAVLGLFAASAAQAQFRIGDHVSSNFATTLRGTPTYVYPPYYAPYYYPPIYADTSPSYYYSPGVSYYDGTPGVSVGVGRPYWNGRTYSRGRYWRR